MRVSHHDGGAGQGEFALTPRLHGREQPTDAGIARLGAGVTIEAQGGLGPGAGTGGVVLAAGFEVDRHRMSS